MANADWVKVNPQSRSGDAVVNVSSRAEHSGRVARTTVLTWKAANVADVKRTVNQAGKPEYVDIDDAASSDKAGKVVTISGVSNSRILTFTLGNGDLDISLPENYMANSLSTKNCGVISGDRVAVAEYPFSLSVSVPANDGTAALTRQIIVTDEGGHQDVCLLTLAAGDAYITVAAGDIELDYLGTPVAVAVESNTTWTIE